MKRQLLKGFVLGLAVAGSFVWLAKHRSLYRCPCPSSNCAGAPTCHGCSDPWCVTGVSCSGDGKLGEGR